MRRAARAARVPRPDLRLAARDPWALRLAALVLLVAALVFARSDGIATLGPALAPKGGAAVAAGPSFDAWVRPPAYTGKPTLYLPEVPSRPPRRGAPGLGRDLPRLRRAGGLRAQPVGGGGSRTPR